MAHNIPCCVCIIGAVVMACNNVDYWGWMLFAALLLARFPENVK